MAFHWADGWYFERAPQGGVWITKRATSHENNPVVLAFALIPADEWASIVASVSQRGESRETWDEAKQFHDAEPPKATVHQAHKSGECLCAP